MSIEPFNRKLIKKWNNGYRLVKLAARAFYDDYTTKGDNQPKIGRSDNRGMAVVILDALTRRQWVREEDLAKDLKVHTKQLRRTLRFFEEEKLVTRDHRKETAKGAKLYSAAVAATTEVQHGKEGEDKVKLHTHSYCCLDYAQIYDVVRYRIQRMRKKLKDESEGINTIQEYVCPNCGRRYNALDAPRLISMDDEFFHCENCNGELVAESDKLTVPEGGDGDDNVRRRRREKVKDMLQKMDTQLKPLIEQLNRVKDIPVPEFGNLLAWEARANAASRANGSNSNDPSKSSQGYGVPLAFPVETKVEVAFSGVDGKEEDAKSESADPGLKILPPWMIKQGMNLTKEQRGEVKQESKMDGSSSSGFSDDKKAVSEDDEKQSLQDEYVKAYVAAILKQKQEQEAANKQQEMPEASDLNGPSESSPQRQVGMKFKREDDEGDDDVDWEEAPMGATGNETNESYRLHDLNEEAKATPEDEDDDIDWEEG